MHSSAHDASAAAQEMAGCGNSSRCSKHSSQDHGSNDHSSASLALLPPGYACSCIPQFLVVDATVMHKGYQAVCGEVQACGQAVTHKPYSKAKGGMTAGMPGLLERGQHPQLRI
jgi:hypothetical protein